MRTDGNEMADALARQGSSHSLTGPEPGLAISAKVARVIRAGRAGNTRSIGSPFMDKTRQKDFLKDPLLKELGNYST
jgi:hypothetical protein